MSQVEYSVVVTSKVVTTPSAYINKANILFVIEDEGSQARPEAGPKLYSFTGKLPIAVAECPEKKAEEYLVHLATIRVCGVPSSLLSARRATATNARYIS